MKLGARIRILRIQRGWTVKHLADIVGVLPQTIYMWEVGRGSNPDLIQRCRLAGAFGMTMHEFMGRAPEKIENNEMDIR